MGFLVRQNRRIEHVNSINANVQWPIYSRSYMMRVGAALREVIHLRLQAVISVMLAHLHQV